MTIDILPTVAQLIGAELPDHKIDGLDISAVILGKTDKSPHEVLYFYYNANDLEALRSGKWKLELPRAYTGRSTAAPAARRQAGQLRTDANQGSRTL